MVAVALPCFIGAFSLGLPLRIRSSRVPRKAELTGFAQGALFAIQPRRLVLRTGCGCCKVGITATKMYYSRPQTSPFFLLLQIVRYRDIVGDARHYNRLTGLQWPTAHVEVIRHYSNKKSLRQTSRPSHRPCSKP